MIGNCGTCREFTQFDYCPLRAEWFCSSCWGGCEDKDCMRCTAIMSAHAK